MNKQFVSIFSAAIVAIGAMGVRASILASDTFTETDGTNLLGTTPQVGGVWATHSGTTNPILIQSGAAVVNDATGVQDDNVPFAGGVVAGTGTGNASVLYASYTITVPAPTTAIVANYFGMFLSGTSSFTSRVWVDTPAVAGDGYRIALTQNSSVNPTTGSAVYSDDLVFGSTYTVVTSYDYANKVGSLWIDPADASATALGTTSDTGFSDAVGAYAFRQSATAGNFIISIDNLKVGTTFADMFAPVPEPTTLSLLGIGAMGLVSRRRR